MDVPGQDGKIHIFINEDGLVSSLVEMADSPVPSIIIISNVGNIEVTHEF
jgi:hypothetical protein